MRLSNWLHVCNGIFCPGFSSLIIWDPWNPGKPICKTSRKQHYRKTLRMAIQRGCLFSVSWNVLMFFFFQFDLRFPMFTQRAMVYVYRTYKHRNFLWNTLIIGTNSVTAMPQISALGIFCIHIFQRSNTEQENAMSHDLRTAFHLGTGFACYSFAEPFHFSKLFFFFFLSFFNLSLVSSFYISFGNSES